MSGLRAGRRSFRFEEAPVIIGWAGVAGKKEREGPLGHTYDVTFSEGHFGEKTWEQAEQKMQRRALTELFRKTGIDAEQVDMVFSGDLLNQCIGSSFPLCNAGIPHIGLYGACSTMAEALAIAAMAVGGGFADHSVSMASSHFAASERQYRFPLGYGGQRTPTSQWTVTGAGAAMVARSGDGPKIRACTLGAVTELGIRDANNMGSAMAPAAYDTLRTHFEELHTGPEDYDRIVTGDLGQLGKEILLELASRDGLALGGRLADCGCMVYDNTRQNVGCGGSGAGCSAIVLCGELLGKLKAGEWKRILFCGTGALLSPVSTQQGLPIPGICHAVSLEGSMGWNI